MTQKEEVEFIYVFTFYKLIDNHRNLQYEIEYTMKISDGSIGSND